MLVSINLRGLKQAEYLSVEITVYILTLLRDSFTQVTQLLLTAFPIIVRERQGSSEESH